MLCGSTTISHSIAIAGGDANLINSAQDVGVEKLVV